MDLDAPIDVTIGPYETYDDELFGYKAAFEAYITVRDDRETEKVKFFANHLQEIENNLPSNRSTATQDRRPGAHSRGEPDDRLWRLRPRCPNGCIQSARMMSGWFVKRARKE